MTQPRIVINPTIAGGAPVIQGKAIPVHEVLARIATIISDEVPNRLLGLEPDEVRMALEYAATVVRQQVRLPDSAQLGDDIASAQEHQELDLKRILVVDDDLDNRTLMRYMFKDSQFKLSMAADGYEALALARAELPVLVVSDIQMPGMSGLDLLRALKADEYTKKIAVILVTAHHRGSKQVSQGLIMGADDYIYRPFMPDEFMSRVEAVLRIKWAEAEAQRQARVIARHNKRLELVNELALAVNSSLDLQEIFASAMQKLSQLLAAEAVSLLLLNEEKQEIVVNISSRTGKRVSVTQDMTSTTKISTHILQEQVPAIVSNILNNHKLNLDLDFMLDPSTIQCIPMHSKENIVGAIAIVDKYQRSFDEADWVLLHSAAGVIAVAMENARLLESAQQQVDDLIALNEIGRALTSTLDLKLILKQTTLLVQQSLEAEAASLWLLDETSQELVLIASSGIGAEVITGFRLPVYSGLAGYVAQTGEAFISGDVSKDERYFAHVTNMSDYQSKSILCVPVQVKGQIIGVMQALHQHAKWFDQNDLRLSYPVANFVGIAVENARLFSKVQDFSRHLEQMVAERTRQLAEEKEKTEAILASMADGLLVLDAENHILTANTVAESMLDFQLSELVGQPIGPERLENPLWRCINNMASSDELTVNVAVDVPVGQTGQVLSTQAHSAKVRNEAKQIIGTVIVLRDITALTEVERMKARFMAGVTHELKTPLAVIRLHSQNLLTYHNRLPEQKRHDLLTSIQTQSKLLEQLVEDILELSRLDAGVSETQRQPVNLVKVLDQIVTDLRPLAEVKGVKLVWQKPAASTSMTTMANINQIERVARNLIDNAIKYTPANGLVKVHMLTELVKGQVLVTIRVIDTGIGIAPEHQARVFERFYRVDPSHTIPGTGLGLAIVKEIVNTHGGQVNLESTPGAGSKFTVTLPALEHS